MIKKRNELDFSNKKYAMIIAGVPGIGKTTLGLSSPRPLLIDLDNGIDRVQAKYRKDILVASSYQELLNDLTSEDLSSYETLVIDTGGKLLEMIKPYIISKDPKNAKTDGSLSLQGYGSLKKEFNNFNNKIKSLNKNIIYVFHASEVSLENDLTGLRIRMEGKSRDEVWDDIDIGGFIEIKGKKRTISFNNCERFYAKGTQGVSGVYELPDLETSPNDFVSKLFDMMHDSEKKEEQETEQYTTIIENGKTIINNCKTLQDLNNAIIELSKLPKVNTTSIELFNSLNNKAKEMGYKYDKDRKTFDNADTTK